MEPPQTLLPPPPARVATLGGHGADSALPEAPWDAAVVHGDALAAADWTDLAGEMIEGGKLLVAAPAPNSPERDALEILLAEAGFAIRRSSKKKVSPSSDWLQAVRTPYRVRSVRGGEEAQILDLFERSFHHRRGADHWRWQYRDNPHQVGAPRVTVATDGEGGLVGHYAGYPVTFERSRSTFLAHQIGDTMTVPEVRHIGRGPTSLLGRCGHHFYARYCRRQVAFNYGFNVGNIQKFSMRFLAAHRVEDVPYWRRDAAEPLPPTATSWLGGPLYRVEADARPDESWDTLFRQAAPHYGALIRRTAEHLRWRYCDRPGFEYLLIAAHRRRTPVAWAVFRRDGDRLLWGDFLCHPRHLQATRDLLAAALEHPTNQGVQTVEGWFTPRPRFLPPVLEAFGFSREPEPQGLALMCVPFEDPSAPEWLGRELYYTLGDGDLF